MLPGHYWNAQMVIRGKDAAPEIPTIPTATKIYRALQMTGLGEVKEELSRLEINLDELGLSNGGVGSLRDLFHPTATYSEIIRTTLLEAEKKKVICDVMSVEGERLSTFGKNYFRLLLYPYNELPYSLRGGRKNWYRLNIPPGEKPTVLKKLEDYFHRRNALHEKDRNYTYRSAQEL